jgi:hypothetical protein
MHWVEVIPIVYLVLVLGIVGAAGGAGYGWMRHRQARRPEQP